MKLQPTPFAAPWRAELSTAGAVWLTRVMHRDREGLSFLTSFIHRFLQHQQEVLSKYLSRSESCGAPSLFLAVSTMALAQDGGMYIRVTGMPKPLVQGADIK